MNKKKIIIIGCLVLVVIGITGWFIYKNGNLSGPIPTKNKNPHKEDDGFKIYNYDGKEYLVYEKETKVEHDIEYFEVSREDSEMIQEYSLFTYQEYEKFCQKYGINRQYNDKDKNYIIYYYATVANGINAKVGGIDINEDNVRLYIWDKVSNGGMLLIDEPRKAYTVIVPVEGDITKHEIIPLMHKVEYNRMIDKSVLDDYTSSLNNEDVAKKAHINSNDSKLNDIINKSLDAIAKEHTIKINTDINGSDAKLTSYMDLVNSVFKIEAGTSALIYRAYTDDLEVSYASYSGDFTYYDKVIDRSEMLYQVFTEFGSNFLNDLNKYEITVSEDEASYIIKTKDYYDATYYLDKNTYLISKVVNDNRINEFSYVNDNIYLPEELSKVDEIATVDKPIIYLYPTKEEKVTVKLLNADALTCSYPKYNKAWEVIAKPNGDLKDLHTNRYLYSLYYESKSVINFKVENEGFVVKGSDTISFLEEKLSLLGLNEREAEEFIIYWLPKLEANKYNYIRFASDEEINKNMPLQVNPKPDNIIRVLMTYKALEERVEVKPQKLVTPNRSGFTVVEWGGTELK